MDLALRVLFHEFQIIYDRIRLTFSVASGTITINKCITAVSTIKGLVKKYRGGGGGTTFDIKIHLDSEA